MEEKEIKLSPPWITFQNEVKLLFAEDPDVTVTYDEDSYTLKLFVDNTDKAMALAKILPEKKEYGNVIVKIIVVPANRDDYPIDKLFSKAFSGNPVLTSAVSFDTPFGTVNYAVFQKKVVQFFNDQMDDINGNRSTLYQEIAKDVFGTDQNIYFCTEATGDLAKPLGEWP